MKYSLIILSLFFTFSSTAQSSTNNFGFIENTSVKVFKNNTQLTNPWAGGINYGEVNTMDLNNDGRDDLVVFDKIGGRVTTYIDTKSSGSAEFEYAPEYRSAFPSAEDWMLLRDFNCDGKMDVFCGISGGVVVYENTSSGSELSFQKAHTEDKLQVTISVGDVNLHVPITDVPGIVDMDGDGDLDILTWGGSVSYVELMENKASCGLNFERKESCWGHFLEDAFTNQVILDTCTPFKNKTLHAGGTLLPLDLNANGVMDVLVSDVSYKNVIALYNTGTADSAFISSQDTNFPASHPINVDLFPASFYEDVDGDGIKDLVVSPNQTGLTGSENYRSMTQYKNMGSNNNPNFQYVRDNFLQKDQIDLGEGCVPRLCDLSGDGLLDLILANSHYYDAGGNAASSFSYFKNTGTASQPEFTLIDSNLSNIASYGLGIMSIPAFGDLDGDNDFDMIVGDQNGQVHYFSNTGNSTNPIFTLTTAGIGSIDVGNAAAPFLYDMDSSGTLDLLVGNELGKIEYYTNSSSTSPNFSLENDFFGGINVRTRFYDGFSVPYVFEHNGLTNIMVGSGRGIYQFDSIKQVVAQPAILSETVGSDTIRVASFNESPYGFSKYVGRNQFLYTAAELKSLGFIQGFVTRISFDVSSSGHSIVQKGITVKMKNTTATDLSSFETGLTIVNEDERVLPGSGVQMDLPFLWDGKSNLVVEICFSGNVFVQANGRVDMSNTSFVSNAWGDVAGNNTVTANGCNLPLLGSSSRRPNIRFQITPAFVNTDEFLVDGHRNSGAFADLDNDGFIDAIVGNYSGGAVYFKGKIYDVSNPEPISFKNRNLEVFPNPGQNIFQVKTENMGAQSILRVFHLNGALISETRIEDSTTEIDLGSQPNGLYLFLLDDGEQIYSQKVIKE